MCVVSLQQVRASELCHLLLTSVTLKTKHFKTQDSLTLPLVSGLSVSSGLDLALPAGSPSPFLCVPLPQRPAPQ